MQDIFINDKKITLPSVDSGILIKDVMTLKTTNIPKITFNSTIAECDIITLKYMKKLFKDLTSKIISCKSSERLVYMQIYEELIHKLQGYTIVKENAPEKDDLQNFTSLEVHRFKDEDLIIHTVSMEPVTPEVIVKNSDGTIYDGSVNVEDTHNIKERIIDVEYTDSKEKNINPEVEEARYKPDPSQIAMETRSEISLYERLKEMNKIGKTFIDEERILDKSLNVQNSINLGKIELGELNVNNSKSNHIVISKTKILEMGRTKYNALKNACSVFNSKLKKKKASFKVKSNINYKTSNINYSNSLVLVAPKSCCNVISGVFNHLSDTSYKDKLVALRNSLVQSEYETSQGIGEYSPKSK